MKLILTSTGFDNENIKNAFLELLEIPADKAQTLFIPTALNTPEAREALPVFIEDLLKVGIPEENIRTYDLDTPFKQSEIIKYDIVFVCPGSPEFLLNKIHAVNFNKALEIFLMKGGVYVGVSAGSDAAAKNFPNGLGYLAAKIETHAQTGSPNGPVDIENTETIKITDNQAVIISGDSITVIE